MVCVSVIFNLVLMQNTSYSQSNVCYKLLTIAPLLLLTPRYDCYQNNTNLVEALNSGAHQLLKPRTARNV